MTRNKLGKLEEQTKQEKKNKNTRQKQRWEERYDGEGSRISEDFIVYTMQQV